MYSVFNILIELIYIYYFKGNYMFKWLKKILKKPEEKKNEPKDKLIKCFAQKYPNKLTKDLLIDLNSLSQSIDADTLKATLKTLSFVKYIPPKLNRLMAVNGKQIRRGNPAIDNLTDNTLPPTPERFEIIAAKFNEYYRR